MKSLGGFNTFGEKNGFPVFGGGGGFAPNSGVSIDPDAQAIIDAMVPTPDAARQILINNFVLGCKADISLNPTPSSNWVEIDILRIRAAHSQQATTLNWKNPALFTSTLVDNPVYTINSNINGNLVGYINENWAPSTDGVKYVLNNASMSIYNINEITSGQMIGAFDGNRAFVYPRNADQFTGSLNTLFDISIENLASTIGHFAVYRQDSVTQNLTLNGVLVKSEAGESSAIPSGNIFECGCQVVGNPFLNNGANAASHYGSGYVDQAKLYARFNTFLTAVGAI